MPSGLASLPHPVFFIGAPSSAPLASAEVATDTAGGILEQAEDVRMEEDRKRKQEEAKLNKNPLGDPDGHQDVVENLWDEEFGDFSPEAQQKRLDEAAASMQNSG